MIFAAGLGTRLQPLTNNKPKALVEINKVPLIDRAVHKLIESGVSEIVINLHHFAEQLRAYVNKQKYNCEVHFSDESDLLLSTGGGLKKAQEFLKGTNPFIVYNVDVISDIDLNKMLNFHCENNCLATLAVRKRKTSRYLLFDEQMQLSGWKNIKTDDEIIVHAHLEYEVRAFSGIHIISPEIFGQFEEKGAFSIIDSYLRLAQNKAIKGYDHSETMWYDLGKVSEISEIEKILRKS